MADADSRQILLPPAEATAVAETLGISEQLAQISFFRVLLRHPRLAKAVREVFASVNQGALDQRLLQLVVLRVAWTTGSVSQWSLHWQIAKGAGLTKEERFAVRDWRSYPGFGNPERAVLAATDETLADGAVSRETWAACEEELTTFEERLELLTAIGTYQTASQLLRTLEIPLEEGIRPWPPDGHGPANWQNPA